MVVDLLRERAVADESPVISAGVEQCAVAVHALEECVEAKALVFSTEVERVEDLGAERAVSDLRAVVGVDLTVVVHVLVLDVAGLHLRESLRCAGVDVGLVLEESHCLQSPDAVERVASGDEVVIGSRFFGLILDLVFVEAERSADVQCHVAHLVTVVCCALKAPAVHDAGVDVRRAETDDAAIAATTVYPNVVAALKVSVELQVETMEDGSVETHIIFICLLVRGIVGGHASECGTSPRAVIAGVEGIGHAVGAVTLRVVSPHVVAGEIVGVDDAEGGAPLEEVYPFSVFHPWLLAHHPGCAERWRHSPLCARCQAAGAGEHPSHLCDVAVAIGIVREP